MTFVDSPGVSQRVRANIDRVMFSSRMTYLHADFFSDLAL